MAASCVHVYFFLSIFSAKTPSPFCGKGRGSSSRHFLMGNAASLLRTSFCSSSGKLRQDHSLLILRSLFFPLFVKSHQPPLLFRESNMQVIKDLVNQAQKQACWQAVLVPKQPINRFIEQSSYIFLSPTKGEALLRGSTVTHSIAPLLATCSTTIPHLFNCTVLRTLSLE